MRRFLTALVVAGVGTMAAAQSSTSPVVVELYTSQGCSSCPSADRVLEKLAGRDDILPLSLHVDYWDYIGWADTFADPAYTQRQKVYARNMGERMIYTPQMVINGGAHVVGNRPMGRRGCVECSQGRTRPRDDFSTCEWRGIVGEGGSC